MIGHDPSLQTSENYRRFGLMEVHGKSPLYEEIALAVADDPELIELLSELPVLKRQPNLFFGAVRYLYGTVAGYREFRRLAVGHWNEISDTMLVKRTQTNEVGRSAALLPILASIPGPLHLLEVGASAGLCLLPDRFGYNFGGSVLQSDSPVQLTCDLRGFEAPKHVPEIDWRLGIDLNPVDPSNPDDRRWLEALVWPEMADRSERLRAALDLAADDPPVVRQGDLRDALPAAIAEAPKGGTLVILHSAVLGYLPADDRLKFVSEVTGSRATWIAYEHPAVLAGIVPEITDDKTRARGRDFVIALDGRPVAKADPHGAWIGRW